MRGEFSSFIEKWAEIGQKMRGFSANEEVLVLDFEIKSLYLRLKTPKRGLAPTERNEAVATFK